MSGKVDGELRTETETIAVGAGRSRRGPDRGVLELHDDHGWLVIFDRAVVEMAGSRTADDDGGREQVRDTADDLAIIGRQPLIP